VHGKPSGVDVALAITGGSAFPALDGAPPSPTPAASRRRCVLVGPSGQPRSTGTMVPKVADATANPADKRPPSSAVLSIAPPPRALRRSAALGTAMNRARLLADLGVSTPVLDGLCQSARDLGAHGAKLTGAGGGGAVIAIAPRDKEAAILAGWKTLAVNGFVATLGAR
jgi:mevalonate kinase